MSFQPYESGIHAVWPGAGEARGTEVCFRCAPWPVARRERTTINSRLSGIALQQHERGIHAVAAEPEWGGGPGSAVRSGSAG